MAAHQCLQNGDYATPTSKWLSEDAATTSPAIDTMILVDVDGVLNVGAAEDGKMPVLFNDANLATAERMWGNRLCLDGSQRLTVENLKAISERRLNRGEAKGETMTTLAAKAPCMVSEVLVRRFAEILKGAGTRRMVVLTSTWQAACNRARVEDLEKRVSRLLGRTFEFDAGTGSEDTTPEGRLEAIGNFVAASTGPGGAASAAAAAGLLHILVLEDFFVTPLSGDWSCEGWPMDSEAAAESYIRSKLPRPNCAAVKLIHTYDEWTPAMLCRLVRCGVGISANDVQRSKEFLALGLDAAICGMPLSRKKSRESEAADAEWSFFDLGCLGGGGLRSRSVSSSPASSQAVDPVAVVVPRGQRVAIF